MNEMAPLITFILSFAVAWAAFLGKLFAVALRRDDKKELLKNYLSERYPTIKITIAAVVVTFFCTIHSSYAYYTYNGLKIILWVFLYFVSYYAWLWEPEEIKTEHKSVARENKLSGWELWVLNQLLIWVSFFITYCLFECLKR